VAALIDDATAPMRLAERGVVLGLATRPDNAAYLREAHPDVPEILHAADDFDQAAAAYQAAHDVLRAEANPSGARHLVAGHLREAAAAERSAGQRFLHHARRPTKATPLRGAME
jgi:hypothetical protein